MNFDFGRVVLCFIAENGFFSALSDSKKIKKTKTKMKTKTIMQRLIIVPLTCAVLALSSTASYAFLWYKCLPDSSNPDEYNVPVNTCGQENGSCSLYSQWGFLTCVAYNFSWTCNGESKATTESQPGQCQPDNSCANYGTPTITNPVNPCSS